MNRQYAPPNSTGASDKFLSEDNRRMLYGILSKDFMKRGTTLTPKLAGQLEKYVNHYVEEVHEVQGSKPLQFLNKEVLLVTAQEFGNILKKPAPAAAVASAKGQPAVIVAARATGKPMANVEETSVDPLFMDTSSRFDSLQKERMDVKKSAPPMPEFKIDFSDDGPSPMELFERAKKAREEAAAAATATSATKDVFVAAETRPPRITIAETATANEFLDALGQVQQTQAQQTQAQQTQAQQIQAQGSGSASRDKGIAVASPNLVTIQDTDRKILSQQVVIKDDDVVSYKEVENNLFVYSANRDWYNNGNDNRYNFNVNFDPANNKQGFGLNPAANIKFKNIVRIEFVKAILPAEGLDVLIKQDASGAAVFTTSINLNALSFPFLTLRINEFDGNNYGTDNNLDNSFAVLQYDANWVSDSTNNAANKGFLAFIPKNLKAQRIWAPTPLATLTKLSLRLERPDGTLVQSSLDTNTVHSVISSRNANVSTTTFYDTTAGAAARYLFVRTTQFFSKFAVQMGDRILFQQFSAINATYPDGALQMTTYMNNTSGLVVIGTGYDNGTAGTAITDGANAVGYANYIVLEAQMADPTTGSTAVDPFGSSAANHNTLIDSGSTVYAGKMINLNRQTQFVFRIITRELDPTSRLRPDNLN
jgi:hypothetical protein